MDEVQALPREVQPTREALAAERDKDRQQIEERNRQLRKACGGYKRGTSAGACWTYSNRKRGNKMNFSTRDLSKLGFVEVTKGDKTYEITREEIRKTVNQALILKAASPKLFYGGIHFYETNGVIFTSKPPLLREEWYEWWYDLDIMEKHIYDMMERGIHADGYKIYCIVYPVEDRDKLLRRFDEIQHLERQQTEESNRQLMEGPPMIQKKKHFLSTYLTQPTERKR